MCSYCAVGCGGGEGAVGCEVQLPAAFVDEVVVAVAEWQQVVDVGRPVLEGVPGDVVDVAVLEWCVAHGAGSVEHA